MGFTLALFSSFILFFIQSFTNTEALKVGVTYGTMGDNLPSSDVAMSLVKARSIERIRIFDVNSYVLKCLENSGIEVIVGAHDNNLRAFALDKSFAKSWVEDHIVPYADTVLFRCISVCDAVIPSEGSKFLLEAIINLDDAVEQAGLNIPVTTTIAMTSLEVSYPPSAGQFTEETADYLTPVVEFLSLSGYPLLVNVYPYFAYASNPKDISLDYALFRSSGVVVKDGPLGYTNLFDAMVDAVHSAAEKCTGGMGVDIVVSETGWPWAGDERIANISNAMAYHNNLIAHLAEKHGTPKRPNKELETYLFSLFNENLKPSGVQQHFGLYYGDLTEVYHVDFSHFN